MTSIMTRTILDTLNARLDSILATDFDGDTNALREALGVHLTDEIGPYAGSGEPADEEAADGYAVCALDTGECVVWGPEFDAAPGVRQRYLVVAERG